MASILQVSNKAVVVVSSWQGDTQVIDIYPRIGRYPNMQPTQTYGYYYN